jgi:hypothetical protein
VTVHIENVHIDLVTITTPTAPAIRWHVGPFVTLKGETMPLEVSMTTEEKARLMIHPTTPGGDDAPVDGPAQWTVTGTCTVEPIDGVSAWVYPGTTIGDSTVTVACDADLGAGVVHIGDTCLVHVSNPMAANVGLTADPPVLQTA